MKRALFVLILICSAAGMHAQGKGRMYNSLVNEAELSITDGNYKEALEKYGEAFRIRETGFATDLYNACVCAAKLEDKATVLLYAGQLAALGVGGSFFTRSIFKTYAENPEFIKIMNVAEKEKTKRIQSNIDYNQYLNKLRLRDSLYNRLRLTKYRDASALPDTLEQLFRKNTRDQLNFIMKAGYYTEKKLGADIGNDTIIRHLRKPDIVFLHYLEMGSDQALIDDIKTLLLQNLENGSIKPANITGMIELAENAFGDIGTWIYNIDNCTIFRKNDLENADAITQARERYMQGSFQDYEKKLLFRYASDIPFDFKYAVLKRMIHDREYFESAFHGIGEVKNCN